MGKIKRKPQEEIWKKIEGFEDYSISSYGNVMNNKTGKELVGNQYRPAIAIRKDGKSKSLTIARLVAQAFIPNPNNYSQVNHINGNPKDNYVENLEWCTDQQNFVHASLFELNPVGHEKHSYIRVFMKYYMVKKLYERAKKERRTISNIMAQALNEYITRNEWRPLEL